MQEVRKLQSGIGILLMIILAGCGGDKRQNESSGSEAHIGLLRSDLSDLNNVDTSGFDQFDRSHHQLLSKIFGGTNPSSLVSFLNARLKYYFAENDQNVDVIPRNILDQNWMRDDRKSMQKVVRGAANIGTQLWLAAIVARVPVQFILHGQAIPVTSSRVGIMLIGEGYVTEMPGLDGQMVPLPPAYRHSMLFHEARHSDCTGGISESDVDVIRTSRNVRDFATRNTSKSCGHLHVYCPRGHQFENYAACDGTAWGSYAVGAIYAKAVAANPTISNLDYNIMQATAIDSESRLLVPLNTNPDMSSNGLRN